MTKAQKQIANENGLDHQTVAYRVKVKGESIEKATSYPPIGRYSSVVNGKKITKAQIEIAEGNGINRNTLKHRLYSNYSVEEAINQPVRVKHSSTDDDMDDESLLEVVGRIKYMQQSDMIYPPTLTKPMEKRLKQMGVSYSDVKPVEVDVSDLKEFA
ncbi:hypothetical protein [Salinicoccus albus]|uniref:hypothetical protein n=1 Tax=Salinicoccus albus TaxID=418756 RepID=UPI0012EA9F55|nr:hypothetical protein [Salinicoccus albus]